MTSQASNTVATNTELEFRNVSLSYDDKPALTNISFRLERGEMIFLTGASASGKSVLLHLAMGLLRPDEGQIFVQGREIENLDESELLAVRGGSMGIVFQEESLFTGMSVYANAAYRLEEHGWEEDKIDKAVREVLRFVGLEGEEEKFPEELSGGMKRRVEIARAMIGWPSIMLFDEPTLSLDPIVAVQILDLIIRARDVNNISSLYVTKKLHEIPYLASYRASADGKGEIAVSKATAEQFADTKIIVLDSGRIAFSGSVAEFEKSNIAAIANLKLVHQTEAPEYYVANPWDKRRKPKEEIL
jgi:phospholipid/cholesterol/gamma-HCH transport system ATP-binding protein